jgi:hypothetical protein
MTIQGALAGNGAFAFSLTGFFAVKNPRSVALQRKKGNVGFQKAARQAILLGSFTKAARTPWKIPDTHAVSHSWMPR